MRQYSKKEIDLLVEIRRRLKKELGVSLQLANPELPEALIGHWAESSDAITRSRIRQFIDGLGSEWQERLDRVKTAAEREARSRSLLS